MSALCFEREGACSGVVRADLNKGGQITLKSGASIARDTADGLIRIHPTSVATKGETIVSWTDKNTLQVKSGALSGVSGQTEISFSVATSSLITQDGNPGD